MTTTGGKRYCPLGSHRPLVFLLEPILHDDELRDWIALASLPGIGPVRARQLVEHYGNPGTVALHVPVEQLALPFGKRSTTLRRIGSARRGLMRRAEREIIRARKAGVSVLPLVHPDYPALLRELPDAPTVLYLRGRPISEGATAVGIVGSRAPTAYGRDLAFGLGASLCERDVVVVSGGAVGVDAEAHRGALSSGGPTVCVLGSGLLRLYPEQHRALFDEIAERGTLVSEFSLRAEPKPRNFPRRNRLISGLAAAVVVVEARVKSGSLITARHALDQGREVLAIPGPVTSVQSEGCNRLIQQGAKLVQRIDDLLEELGPMYREATGTLPLGRSGSPRDESAATPDEWIAYELIDAVKPIHIDELADSSPIGLARLHAALFGLELRGWIEVRPGRLYVRTG